MYTQIEVETHSEGKIQIVYLNNSKTFNALTKTVLAELAKFFNECSKNEIVRCVAISGKGKAFCSGQNLEDIVIGGNDSKKEKVVHHMVENYYNPMVTALTNCNKPVVALVNGPAVGAGAMLGLICDFVLASEKAYFSQAFANIGLVPDTGGTYFLPKLVGRQMAHYLTYTGKKLSSKEAQQLGLVAEVFSEEEFADKSLAILSHIAEMPTAALNLTKFAFAQSYGNSLEDQLKIEADFQQKASETDDFKEGVTAFLQKRKPQYKGK